MDPYKLQATLVLREVFRRNLSLPRVRVAIVVEQWEITRKHIWLGFLRVSC